MFKNILVPTDGSPLSQKAAIQGVELAKAIGAKVTALFAAPPATPVVYRHHLPVGFAQPEDHEEMIKRASEEYLGAIQEEARRAGVSCDAVQVTSDFPDEAILQVAEKHGCDVIVMGTSGQGGLRGLFIGSVTQKVLNQSKVPVLVMR